MADVDRLGSKIGPRVAKLAADAVIYSRTKLSPHQRSVALGVVNDFFDLVGDELRTQAGDFAVSLADADAMPSWASRLLRFAGQGRGQGSALLSFALYGTGFANSLTGLLVNELNPAMSRWIAANPNAYLTPQQAAALAARGIWNDHDASYEAARGGYDQQRFDLSKASFLQAMPAGQTLDALNRGEIDEGAAREALLDAGIAPRYIPILLSLRRVLLTPADAALMVIRGIIDDATGRHIAAQSGLDAQDFERLVLATGDPPGIAELLFLYRRGEINHDRLVRGIRQSRVRNEWVDAIEALRYQPMSPQAAIQAHVQGHLDERTSRDIAQQGGLRPEDWDPLFETAGNPPGVQTILDLWDRRILSTPEATQALRESQLKNKYIPAILESAVWLPPVRTIVAMYHRGSLTQPWAIDLLKRNGVEPDLAAALIAEGQARKTEKTRDLAVGEVRTLYAAQAITREEAAAFLSSLGYDDDEVQLELEVVELQRVRRFTESAIGRVHSLYVAHKVDENQASVALDSLRVPPAQRDDLLNVWTFERQANVRTLTESQVVTAARRGILQPGEAFAELVNMGYVERDAAVLLANAGVTLEGA